MSVNQSDTALVGYQTVEECLKDLYVTQNTAIKVSSPQTVQRPYAIGGIEVAPVDVVPYPPLPTGKKGKAKRITEERYLRIMNLRKSIDEVNEQAKKEFDGNTMQCVVSLTPIVGVSCVQMKYRRTSLAEVLGVNRHWTVNLYSTEPWRSWDHLTTAVLEEMAKNHRIVISELTICGMEGGWLPTNYFQGIEMQLTVKNATSPIYKPGNQTIIVNWGSHP